MCFLGGIPPSEDLQIQNPNHLLDVIDTHPMATSQASILSPAFHVQVAVIGAGVLGLACARSLAQHGREVLLLDRASAICSETSSRNSEVIHAGIYYPQSSLKAKFCVQGKHQLYDYIQDRKIPHKKCGKLIVATEKDQLNRELAILRHKAEKNGVTDLQLLSRNDVRLLEPEVECHGALWSPSTGVIDSHSFFLSLLADAEQHEVQLVLNSAVTNAEIKDTKVCLQIDDTWISCDNVINCAGLYASEVASMIHNKDNTSDNKTKWTPPKYYYAKGTYFRLQGRPPFQHLIYPVPEQGGLGVHATLDWNSSSVKFGPDVEWLDTKTTASQIKYDPDPQRGKSFYNQVWKYWPNLPKDKLVPDYVGVRPKLSHPAVEKVTFDDFRIEGKESHGVDGLVHMFGIESPGLTSSMAIAEHVTNILIDKNR